MHLKKNKKILIYLFLFVIIGTVNNKNFKEINFLKINEIKVKGLDQTNNFKLIESLHFLKIKNLLFLKKTEITKIINSNSLVEEFTVFKNYPSAVHIKIIETKFLAQIMKSGNIFLLGSNGKLTKTPEFRTDIPFIFGNFKNDYFFNLKKAIDETGFDYNQIKKFYYFKSGRWDIETINGLLIKLPKNEIKKSLKRLINILNQNQDANIKKIDLRQYNQIIING